MILNLSNGKYYIGQAFNFYDRCFEHFRLLRLNKHGNIYLQNAYNKYGEDCFQFTIIETVEDQSQLTQIEQIWIDVSDCCNQKIGYNICPIAYSVRGIKLSFYTRIKMSNSAKIKIFSDVHRFNMSKSQLGKKHTIETKKKMSIAAKGKPKSEQHKINAGKAKRTFDKWPHDKGNRCTCRECKDKKNSYYRNKYNES